MKLLLLSFGVVPKNSIYKFQGKKKMIKTLLSLTQLRMCEAKILFIFSNKAQGFPSFFPSPVLKWLMSCLALLHGIHKSYPSRSMIYLSPNFCKKWKKTGKEKKSTTI